MKTEEYLTLDIIFYMQENRYETKSDMTLEGQINLLEWFLMDQSGAGGDGREAIDRKVYRITLKWNPDHDQITCDYNTGNKGLREGILTSVLKKLDVELKKKSSKEKIVSKAS